MDQEITGGNMENVKAFDEWPIEELVHLEEMLTNVNSSWDDPWTIPAQCRDAGTPNMADFYAAILGEIGSVLDSARIGLVTKEPIGGQL
jgi:hypothetical protein